jgi:hypothetical protein
MFKSFLHKILSINSPSVEIILTGQLSHEQKMAAQNTRFESIDWPLPITENQLMETEVFPSRENVLQRISKGIDYLEVGVLGGDYTEKFVTNCNPNSVFLVDTFCSNDWFHSSKPRFTAETHENFVRERFASLQNLNLFKGLSQDVLPKIEQKFDYIYLDADHSYDAVWSDINNAATLLKPGGIIGMNDYIMWDYVSDEPYGVVQATNKFLSLNPDWKVSYYAFSTTLFSDIYIKKPL